MINIEKDNTILLLNKLTMRKIGKTDTTVYRKKRVLICICIGILWSLKVGHGELYNLYYEYHMSFAQLKNI